MSHAGAANVLGIDIRGFTAKAHTRIGTLQGVELKQGNACKNIQRGRTFDCIYVNAAAHIPPQSIPQHPLVQMLADGGTLVMPIGYINLNAPSFPHVIGFSAFFYQVAISRFLTHVRWSGCKQDLLG
jgi:protein-L-isoaspartate O-methyltransferase